MPPTQPAAPSEAPPPPPGPRGAGPVILVTGLPAPAVLDAGFEPIEVAWPTLDALLVATEPVGRGTRQAFQKLEPTSWGARPIWPVAYRRDAEPLFSASYWHPIPGASILLVPHRPIGRASSPNVALYSLAGPERVQYVTTFREHGMACATPAGLAEDLAVHSGGEEIRRVYGCPGTDEEAFLDVLRVDGSRVATQSTRASFLVHRQE